ncbi:MAG: hypothetical protein R2788_27565 [Saprospiraceae bacterium]
MIKEADDLSIQSKSEMTEYLASFYNTIEDEGKGKIDFSDE